MFGDLFMQWFKEQLEDFPDMIEDPYKAYECLINDDIAGFRKQVNAHISDVFTLWKAVKATYKSYKEQFSYLLN